MILWLPLIIFALLNILQVEFNEISITNTDWQNKCFSWAYGISSLSSFVKKRQDNKSAQNALKFVFLSSQ